MAGQLDAIDKMPVWQRIVAFVFVGVLIAAGWYFLFWTDAVDANGAASAAVAKAEGELKELATRKENFLQEQRAHEKRQEEFNAKMEILPMASSAVDNLMHTFQQKANIGGFTVESWTNETEERRDFYARLPIKVKATGTWSQTAEFFRKISELKQIVSVENIGLTAARSADDPGGNPLLKVEFEAATYRFLSDAERTAAESGPKSGTARKKKKKGKK